MKKDFIQQHAMRQQNWERLCQGVAFGYRTKRQLQQATGLAWGTVSNGINELCERGVLLAERLFPKDIPSVLPASLHGKNLYYSFRSDSHLSAGFSIRKEYIHGVLLSADCREMACVTHGISAPISNDTLLSELQACYEKLLISGGFSVSSGCVSVVNLALTGAFHRKNGHWLNSVHISGIDNWPVPSADAFPGISEIRCEHDIISKARAVTRDEQSFVFFHIGAGIGMIECCNGRFLEGKHGFAGEIGHVPYPAADGLRCSCGQIGCLENVLSLRGLEFYSQKQYGQSFSECLLKKHKKEFWNYLRSSLIWLLITAQNLCDSEIMYVGGEAVEPFMDELPEVFEEVGKRAWQGQGASFKTYSMDVCDTARGAALGGISSAIQSALGKL